MKITAKAKEYLLQVKVKTTAKENVNEKELDRFSRLFLRGFLKPSPVKKNVIEYTGPVGVSLYERLKRPLSKRDFLFIIEQIVVAVQKMQSNNLPINNLLMDTRYVFINEATKEVQFLYVPLIEGMANSNLIQFIETVAYSVIPGDLQDNDFVSRFVYYFRALKPFNINAVEAFVNKEDRSVVNTIKKQNAGQSGFMTNKPQHYYDHYDKKNAASEEDERTGLLAEEDERTGLLVENEEATGLLTDSEDEATGLLNYTQQDEATGLLSGGEDEATGLLIENAAVHFPTLFRTLTEETVSINKPVFRIGKENSYVDYFISNNVAISRSHADIITRGNRFFVKDLNSKNRTYINDRELPVQTEVEINDGDNLRLANEEFIFKA